MDWICILNGGDQLLFKKPRLGVRGVREDASDNRLVRLLTHRPKEDEQRKRTADHGNRDTNLPVPSSHRQGNAAGLFRLGVEGNNRCVGRELFVARRLLFNIEAIERLFSARNQDLFGPADDEIAAVVVAALTHLVEQNGIRGGGCTERGAKEDRKFEEVECTEERCVFHRGHERPVRALGCEMDANQNVGTHLGRICEVAQTGLVGQEMADCVSLVQCENGWRNL